MNFTFLLCGDLSFHVDNPRDISATSCIELLSDVSDFDLKHYITGPTHDRGHTLDLLISKCNQTFINNI